MVGIWKETGPSLHSAAIQTKRELIQRMEDNFACLQMEIAYELKIPTLGNTDKELWTLFVKRTVEGLETTTQTNLMEREKTLLLLPQTPPSPKKGGKGKGRKGKTLTIQQQLTYVQQHNAIQCTPQHIVIAIAHHHGVVYKLKMKEHKKCTKQFNWRIYPTTRQSTTTLHPNSQ